MSSTTTNLREYVYQSCKESHRNLYDLLRVIALFVPDDHDLARVVMSKLYTTAASR